MCNWGMCFIYMTCESRLVSHVFHSKISFVDPEHKFDSNTDDQFLDDFNEGLKLTLLENIEILKA